MNIILIAPPAAGKGTQSELICDKYHLNHISTGDLLRNAISNGSSLGNEIKQKMDNGSLIDDEIILNLVNEKILDEDNFVFDGFPRNLNQAIKFDELLNKCNKKIDYVIYLKIDKETAKMRITSRYVCSKCNNVYNIKNLDNMMCPNCHIELSKRSDDTEEVFDNRYDTYMKETYPIINYYKEKNLLYEVDSSNEPSKVFNDIEGVLND